jgi:hypothetical protein
VLFAVKLAIDANTATGACPVPGDGVHGALDPYEVDVPYSSSHLLTSPSLGLTVAFKLAEVCVIPDAASVATVGELGSVLNVWSLP